MSAEQYVDMKRIPKLIKGDITPETLAEEVFVLGYKSGISGEMFSMTLLFMADLLDSLTKEEQFHIMLGYAWGQKDLTDAESDMDSAVKDQEKKKLH